MGVQAKIDPTTDEIHIWDEDQLALTVTFGEARQLARDLLWLVSLGENTPGDDE